LRAVTRRGSTNVADANVFQPAMDRLHGGGSQP
jgi:hypothetical protein